MKFRNISRLYNKLCLYYNYLHVHFDLIVVDDYTADQHDAQEVYGSFISCVRSIAFSILMDKLKVVDVDDLFNALDYFSFADVARELFVKPRFSFSPYYVKDLETDTE
jgi:hypothetical protein